MIQKEKIELKSERDLALVGAKAPELYQDAPLTTLTAYSLFWLHNWEIPRTIEAIAVLSWRLFPEKFSMVGFIEYPDAFRTNRSLLQMQPKYRNLLTGSASKGFSLNSKGMEVAREFGAIVGPPTKDDGSVLGSKRQLTANPVQPKTAARSIEPAREIRKLRETKLFAKWQGGQMTDRDLIHVHALLGIFDHTPTAIRKRAMKELEINARKAGDEEATRFLEEVKTAFPEALVR